MHPLPNLDFPPFPTLAYLLRIFWPPFTFSTPNLAPLFFRHGVLPLPTCTPGLKSPQALRRTNLKAAFFLFWLQLGQTKWPHYKLAPATPTISGFTAREMSQRLCGWISASSWCSYRQCPLIANVKIVMRKKSEPQNSTPMCHRVLLLCCSGLILLHIEMKVEKRKHKQRFKGSHVFLSMLLFPWLASKTGLLVHNKC